MGKLDSGSSEEKSSSKSSNSGGGGGSLSSSGGSSSSSSSSKTSNSSSSSDKGSSGSKSSNSNQSIANAEKSSGSNEGRSGSDSSSGKNTSSSMSSAGNPGSRSSYSADKLGASLSYEGGSSKNSPLSSSEKAELRDAILSSTSFSGTGPGASLEQLQELITMFGPGEQAWAPPLGGGIAELPTGPIGFDPMNPAYPAGYGAPGAAPGTGWNPMQFLEDAMAEGEKRRAERAAEGYAGNGAPVDLEALLWDLNAPYREREVAAGGRPFEGPVDWEGLQAAFLNPTAQADRDGALREARLRAASDAPDKGAQWAELMDFAVRDARLPSDPAAGRGENFRMASAGEMAELLAGEGAKYGKVGDQIGQTMGGIGDLLTAYAPGADVPLPRERPGYAPSAMDMAAIEAAAAGQDPIEIVVRGGNGRAPEDALRLPGQVEGALPQRPGGPETKEPSLWDNVVDMGGKVLENTTLGGIASTLFPDLWTGAGEAIKGIGSGGLSGMGAQSNRPGDAFWEFQHQGSLSEPVDSGGGYYGGAPVVPPPGVPPFPDTNNNGIDDRLEGGTTNEYDRFGQVVFPDMPPYNPGRDNEWLYFRKRAAQQGMANGGIVGYADGGMVEPSPLAAAPGNNLNMADPRVQIIAAAEDALENALEGAPQPDDEADVTAFVEAFGQGALERLKENVMGGMKMRRGRMVRGPGGPKDDMVPAVVDGDQPVNLSNGEFIISAAAVEGAGDGDPMVGAEKLMALNDALSQAKA